MSDDKQKPKEIGLIELLKNPELREQIQPSPIGEFLNRPKTRAWIEKNYSSRIYPTLAKCTQAISDNVPISMSHVDLGLMVAMIVLKKKGFAKLYTGYKIATKIRNLAGRTYLANRHRKPIEDKLELELKPLNRARLLGDVDTCVGWINEAYSQLPDSIDKRSVLSDCRDAALEYVFVVEGITPALPKRIKTDLKVELLKHIGVGGMFSPVWNEVYMPRGEFTFFTPFAYTHELMHAAGYGKESEAQIGAYLATSTAENSMLRYSAHASRLAYTIKMLQEAPSVDRETRESAAKDLIEKLEIPTETKEQILLKYKGKKWAKKAGDVFSGLMDISFRQLGIKDGVNDYTHKFIRLVHAMEDKE